MGTPTLAKKNGGFVSDFFGSVSSGVQSGVSTIASEVLPIWVANNLNVQTKDQLRTPTFNPNVSPPRVDRPRPTQAAGMGQSLAVGGTATQTAAPTAFGNLLTTQNLVLIGGGVLLLALLIPMLRR